MHLRCRRGVVFHNITPSRFYGGAALAEELDAGRAQLAALAPHSELSIGVSNYNARELREAGHARVHTVPLWIEPERFAPASADETFLRSLQGPGPVLLCVGRVLPHKRIEDVVLLHREVRQLRPQARLLIVGGYAEGSASFRALSRLAANVGHVSFLGRLSHAELVAAYRASDLFVSMSEHEGFGVPLLEAMACDLPVLAFGAAAVPETLGGSGIVFTEKRFALLAELVREICESAELREGLVAGQRRRLEALSVEHATSKLRLALEGFESARPRMRISSPRKRVGIIVQRFGPASGGAERHAREIALRLSKSCDVSVLTSCATNHLTWRNELPEGLSSDGPLRVHRFPTPFPRQSLALNRLSKRLFRETSSRLDEELWMAMQGPVLPGLQRHLEEARGRYDAFIAFTYLYAPTAHSVSLLGKQCLVVPTAHDEPPLGFGIYREVFERPAALLCNTREEIALIQKVWPKAAPCVETGVGVDAPAEAQALRFRARFGLTRPYLLYVGRIEHDKGIPELLRLHRKLVRSHPDAPELVLAGDARLKLLTAPSVRYVGRISEQDKANGIAGAISVVVPSRLESLSLLALEAFAHGVPILANGDSPVLAGHVERSGAGRLFTDVDSYVEGVQFLQRSHAELRTKALRYAKAFTWERVMGIYLQHIHSVASATLHAPRSAHP
jgi:glycosyltransferase involved in cell wall biosynthesis